MPDAKPWQPDTPHLYRCRAILQNADAAIDAKDTLFGYRSFNITSLKSPRPNLPPGMPLLNGQATFLRGTDVSPSLNALAYWHQDEKLLDVLLLIKAANFNAIRACEHVNFPEIRELYDRLGFLVEQDQGGGHNTLKSGYTNPNTKEEIDQLAQAAAQLARVCYNNPSVVLISAASETNFDPTPIIQAVHALDPDRILIPISGNMNNWASAYEGPPGYKFAPELWEKVLDDFHCYHGWYSQKGEVWKFNRPRPPTPRMLTVGEFGIEALDSYETMSKNYPPHFKPTPPESANELFGHVQIQKDDPRQRFGLRGQQPRNLADYIRASQSYQTDSLAELATSFRLAPKTIAGYFQFHFFDALPAHWPKSILSHDLTPKPAYFEMAQVNQPVIPLFRITNHGKSLELYLASDLPNPLPNCQLSWTITAKENPAIEGKIQTTAPALDAALIQTIELTPITQDTATITLTLHHQSKTLQARYQREVYLKAWRDN